VELRVFGRVWLSRLSYAVFISSALAEVEALIALQSGKSSTLGEAVIIAQITILLILIGLVTLPELGRQRPPPTK
jgi:hypothetical protein